MGWKGGLIGGGLGALFGHSALGAALGAWIGHSIEERGFKKRRRGAGGPRRYAAMPDPERSQIFCATVAAMLAKIAKADGRVSPDEIAQVEAAFARLGFSVAARNYAVNVFRRAKDDRRSIYEYAEDFADVVESLEVRELLYEILWDVACADGRVGPEEMAMLQRLPLALRIRPDWFHVFASARLRGGHGGGRREERRDPLAEAYAVLGAKPGDSDDDLKRKYRDLAKRNHPDALRAQGLPEAMVGKATERMSRINAAWAAVKEAREL